MNVTTPRTVALVAAWQTEAEAGNRTADVYLRMVDGVDPAHTDALVESIARGLPGTIAELGRLVTASGRALDAVGGPGPDLPAPEEEDPTVDPLALLGVHGDTVGPTLRDTLENLGHAATLGPGTVHYLDDPPDDEEAHDAPR